MFSERTKGWLTSLVAHGLLGFSVVYFAGAGAVELPPVKEAKTLVINLNGDNSTPAPGDGGGDSVMPKGVENPEPTPPDKPTEQEPEPPQDLPPEPPPPPPKPEEPKPKDPPPKPEPKPKPKPKPVKPEEVKPKPKPKEKPPALVSLDTDKLQKAHKEKKATQPKPTRPQTTDTGRKTTNAKPLDASAILGPRAPRGTANGIGRGGSPNGGGPELSAYRDRLVTVMHAHWQKQLDASSARIPPGTSGIFRFTISNNGTINFAGWVKNPMNPAFEAIVRRTLDAIGNSLGRAPIGFPGIGEDLMELVAET